MLELFRLIVIGGFLTVITFMVLLALPQCRLREILMPFVAWGFVALCGAYALSPVDILPEALVEQEFDYAAKLFAQTATHPEPPPPRVSTRTTAGATISTARTTAIE